MDDGGRTAAALRAVAGQVQVLAMVYTTCESACPIIVSSCNTWKQRCLQNCAPRLASCWSPLIQHGIHPLSSARIAPGWASILGAPPGHPDDVLELATLLGIKYKRDQSGGFIHSNVITVLNKAGEIVHRHEGLQQDMASTLEAIRRAVQD